MGSAIRTDASLVTARLRDEIIRGVITPGTKLKLVPLAQRYKISRGPLREAANRLAAQGFVVIEDQKGFRVAPISRTDLLDLTRTRQRIETMALRDAIAAGDLAWEGQIMAALHVLQASSRLGPEFDQDHFATNHRAFHRALCSACPSMYLQQFRENLYDHAERYRNLAAERYRSQASHRNIPGEHAAIAKATVERDADRAAQLLQAHLQETAQTLLDSYPTLFPPTG
ncbi:MAG: FCD domain-containing protein [Myxococcota bacterium]